MKPKPQHAKAHIITKLEPVHEIGEWHEPHGTLQHVAHVDEKYPGIILHARLGASGLQLLRGEHAVCLPLEVLFAAAAKINPQFAAAPNGKLTPAELVAVETPN